MTPYRLIAYAVGALLVLGLLFAGFRAIYDAGDNAGQEKVQLLWDQDKALIQKEADRAVAKATQEKEAAIVNNGGITSDLQTQLDSMRDLNRDLSGRLRDAEGRASAYSGALSKAADQLRVTPGTATQGLGRFNDALADALNECGATRAEYKALIAEIRPQL